MYNEIQQKTRKLLSSRYLDPDNSKIKTMIMYSGGADSLSLAKNILECTSHKIFLHHVVLKNFEERDQFQLDVLPKQLHFLKKIRQFEFIKSTTEMKIPSEESKYVGLDLTTSLFMGGRSCLALKNQISAIYTGHLLATSAPDLFEGISVLNALFTNKRFKPNWILPFRSLNQSSAKLKIYESIGPDGLALTVSCRAPTKTNGDFTSCKKCHACKARENAVRTLKWNMSLVR